MKNNIYKHLQLIALVICCLELYAQPNKIYYFALDEHLMRIEQNGLFGALDVNGKQVIPFKYEKIYSIGNGYYLADEKNDGTNLSVIINAKGEVLTGKEYYSTTKFSNEANYIIAYLDNYFKAVILDKNLKKVLPTVFDEVYLSNDGFITYKNKTTKKFGIKNLKGEQLVPETFDYLATVNDGLALTLEKDKYGYINTKGATVIEPQFKYANGFKNGYARVQFAALPGEKTGGYNIINTKGELQLAKNYTDISTYNKNGFFVVKEIAKNITKAFLYDAKNKKISTQQYDAIEYDGSKDNFIAMLPGYYRTVLNNKGQEILKPIHSAFTAINNTNYYTVYSNSNYGALFTNGKMSAIKYKSFVIQNTNNHIAMTNDTITDVYTHDGKLVHTITGKANTVWRTANNKTWMLAPEHIALVNVTTNKKTKLNGALQTSDINAEGYAFINYSNSKFGLLDANTGKIFDTLRVGKVLSLQNNSIIVQDQYNTKKHFIYDYNLQLQSTQNSVYEAKSNFIDGLATYAYTNYNATYGVEYAYIRPNGKKLNTGIGTIKNATAFNNNRSLLLKDKWYIIDTTGKTIASLDSLNLCKAFDGNYAPIQNNKLRWGFVNRDGKITVPCIYKEVVNKDNYIIAKTEQDKLIAIDAKTNKTIIAEGLYSNIYLPKDGYNDVMQNNKAGILDISGKTVLPIEYNGAISMGNGLFIAQKDSIISLYNNKAKLIKQLNVDNVNSTFKTGYATVVKKGLQGLIDTIGKEVLPCKYLYVGNVYKNYVIVKEDAAFMLVK